MLVINMLIKSPELNRPLLMDQNDRTQCDRIFADLVVLRATATPEAIAEAMEPEWQEWLANERNAAEGSFTVAKLLCYWMKGMLDTLAFTDAKRKGPLN